MFNIPKCVNMVLQRSIKFKGMKVFLIADPQCGALALHEKLWIYQAGINVGKTAQTQIYKLGSPIYVGFLFLAV